VTLSFGQTSIAVRLAEGALDLEVSPRTEFGGALGTSVAMRHVFALLDRAAKAAVTVLFEAESGCGKEVLAYALHQESQRAEGPFVAVDCASLPENLIESELFGHERGAFTGAVASRAGAFERATGGTIFLDELGELPLEQQAKLLRVLEKREIRRVGGSKTIPIDVRVVAATNRRLAEAVRRREFREDLYYRISVIRVVIPPLRDRREDIPALAQYFLERIRGADAQVPADLVQVLLAHPWPGNVRELRNVVERWATFESARPEVLFGESINAPGGPKQGVLGALGDLASLPYHEAKRRVLEAFDRAYFPDVLARTGGVVAKAAELAQVPRPSFHRMLSRARAAEGASSPNSGNDDE
jgi:transcriptional regulator with PAS, ATPase and Fis domain